MLERPIRVIARAGMVVGVLIASRAVYLRAGLDDDPATLKTIRAIGAQIGPLHERKRPSRPGEWLDQHLEAGQSFDAYRAERPNRPNTTRTTLYLQPIGTFSPTEAALLEKTSELMGLFYGLPVRRLDPAASTAIPAEARRTHPRWGGKQIDSLFVLDLLRDRRPDDAVAVLALTAMDLWPNEPGRSWNFVFGQASLRDRVGVWSIARFGDADEDRDLVLRRTLKVALHETGHMLGIRHCTAFECGMNGSNHLPESDRQPLWFCPQCEMKVLWACRLDPAPRYENLAAFSKANGLDAEARFWRRSRAALGDDPD